MTYSRLEEKHFYSNYDWLSSPEEEELYCCYQYSCYQVRLNHYRLNEFRSTSSTTPVHVLTGQAPEFRPTVKGEFYYRNSHFDSYALSLVVCCALHGVYTAADTAYVLSLQKRPYDHQFQATADDVKVVLCKVMRENSTAYQVLQQRNWTNELLLCAILHPMIVEGRVRMQSFFNIDGYEILPSWYPKMQRLSFVEEEFIFDYGCWLSKSRSKSPITLVSASTGQTPEFLPTVDGEFYYRNSHYDSSALSLVVCCAIHGVYTAQDTAYVLSRRQRRYDPLFKATADDVKVVLQKVILENSMAYQHLRHQADSSLVNNIMYSMVEEGCGCMRSFFTESGQEIRPSWHPSLARREISSDSAENVKFEASSRVDSNSAEEVKTEDFARATSELAEEVNYETTPLQIIPNPQPEYERPWLRLWAFLDPDTGFEIFWDFPIVIFDFLD